MPGSIALFASVLEVFCLLHFIHYGKKGDPKFPILPSRTRKGIVPNTSVTLDSPSVLSNFDSPPPPATTAESTLCLTLLMMLLLLLMIFFHLVPLLSHRSLLLER